MKATHPNARGFYPTPLTIALSSRDYACHDLRDATKWLLQHFPSISLAYLLDVLASVYARESRAELKRALPAPFQTSPEFEDALNYAYPPITSFGELDELDEILVPYAGKVGIESGKAPQLLIRNSDLILSPIPVPNYKGFFGVTDEQRWDQDLSSGGRAKTGLTSYFYVRLQNTGNTPIVPHVSIWYSRSRSIIRFDEIYPVGHHFFHTPLQPGEKDVVEIVWEGPDAPGDFDFIGVIDSPRNPVLVSPESSNFQQYNNIALRNFDVG